VTTLLCEDPNFRNEAELREVRAFKEAAADVYHGGSGSSSLALAVAVSSSSKKKKNGTGKKTHHTVSYDHRLGRYYMWWGCTR
jgi:hypothetical protein